MAVCFLVPGAGITHAASAIAEAKLAGIPILIVTGGIARDNNVHYQIHEINQSHLVQEIAKAYYCIDHENNFYSFLQRAYMDCLSCCPGPVIIEIPLHIQSKKIKNLEYFFAKPTPPKASEEELSECITLIQKASHLGLYVGWGSVHARLEIKQLSQLLQAPVATTMQGFSALDYDDPHHVGFGFSYIGSYAAKQSFKNCDLLLAIGVRFSSLATAAASLKLPEKLIHVDIDKTVFNKNYPAELCLQADSQLFMQELIAQLKKNNYPNKQPLTNIAVWKEQCKKKWLHEKGHANKVNPYCFFQALNQKTQADTFFICDDGKHTFLSLELLAIQQQRGFISPTDFNAMGYSIPAAIGTKIAHPQADVVCILGDGALLMNNTEFACLQSLALGIAFFVFNDGELGQIAELQSCYLLNKTATLLPSYDMEKMAATYGLNYYHLESSADCEAVVAAVLKDIQQGHCCLINVNIDYSFKTDFTKGNITAALHNMSLMDLCRTALQFFRS